MENVYYTTIIYVKIHFLEIKKTSMVMGLKFMSDLTENPIGEGAK